MECGAAAPLSVAARKYGRLWDVAIFKKSQVDRALP